MRLFRNRTAAARELAEDLAYLKKEEPIVIALPNGGVPVAAIVAEALHAPLDILLVEKLTAPKHPEHVVGAVDEHGRISMIQSTARWHHLTGQQMICPARQAFASLQPRRERFRSILPELEVRGRTVILVTDAVESGARLLGAVVSMRDRGARKVIVAAPAGMEKSTWPLHEIADIVVIPHRASNTQGVARLFDEFETVTDEVVAFALRRWAEARPEERPGVKTIVMRFITPAQHVLHCELDLPPDVSRGSGPYPAVIFAHGFDSDARSPRSVPISRRLAKRGIVGVRMDFTGHGRSEGSPEQATEDQMLSDLRTVWENVSIIQEVDPRCIAINGSGTGAMVAIRFAATEPAVAAMVIRGPVCGREVVASRVVRAPTLIIHAEHDTALEPSIELLDRQLAGAHQLLRIPDSSRLFGDPISLELMVSATVDWLVDHLTKPKSRTASAADATEAPQEPQAAGGS